jgi:hypothetical protein
MLLLLSVMEHAEELIKKKPIHIPSLSLFLHKSTISNYVYNYSTNFNQQIFNSSNSELFSNLHTNKLYIAFQRRKYLENIKALLMNIGI